MNIFILDSSPAIAASYHCDNHIHKMILESAQMASTAARVLGLPESIYPAIYQPTYPDHPCTKWVSEHPANLAWLWNLAHNLEMTRLSLGHAPHKSMDVLDLIQLYAEDKYWVEFEAARHTPFAEAMYPRVQIRRDMTTVQKYQHYYRLKFKAWGLTGSEHLQYKGRSVPNFLLTPSPAKEITS